MHSKFSPIPIILFALLVQSAQCQSAPESVAQSTPELLPPDLEIELALSGLPPHLRSDASVLTLARGGYVETRNGSNGFTCLVRRSGAIPGRFSDALLPVCYDAEGTQTLLPAVLDEVKLLEEGQEPGEVQKIIASRWADGNYTEPGPGVAYMLSPIFHLNGRDGGYVPHLMFYAPNKTDAEVGASDDRLDFVPFIQAPGSPGAVMVVPVGVQERAEITQAEQSLIDRVQAYLNR